MCLSEPTDPAEDPELRDNELRTEAREAEEDPLGRLDLPLEGAAA